MVTNPRVTLSGHNVLSQQQNDLSMNEIDLTNVGCLDVIISPVLLHYGLINYCDLFCLL